MHPGRHLYVHVPFCRGKCVYCAFFSVPYDDALVERYLDAMQTELAGLVDRGRVAECDTLYVGGGTPSVLSDRQWARLLSILAPVVPPGTLMLSRPMEGKCRMFGCVNW